MSPRTLARWLGAFLVGLAITFVGWAWRRASTSHCGPLTVVLDQAEGLLLGDAVYLQDKRIGHVSGLEAQGRPVAIPVVLDCYDGLTLPEDAQFYLWHDVESPQRKSLRVLAPRFDP